MARRLPRAEDLGAMPKCIRDPKDISGASADDRGRPIVGFKPSSFHQRDPKIAWPSKLPLE